MGASACAGSPQEPRAQFIALAVQNAAHLYRHWLTRCRLSHNRCYVELAALQSKRYVHSHTMVRCYNGLLEPDLKQLMRVTLQTQPQALALPDAKSLYINKYRCTAGVSRAVDS